MGNTVKKVDIQNLLSLGDDLLGVLKNSKDADGLMAALDGAKVLHLSCLCDADEIQNLLEDYEKKMHICNDKIEKTKDEMDSGSELEHLQHELTEKLQEEQLLRKELRAINDKLAGFERQRISIEEKRDVIDKREKELRKAKDLLSMYASVTNVIPNLDDQTKISCYVVERSKKKIGTIVSERTESPVHVCNKLWKMTLDV